jgi:hypothetical protein
VNQVFGTYANGLIVPDQPVDWPEGSHVTIVRDGPPDASFDSPIDAALSGDSPEALQRWREWFESQEPLFTGEALEKFEADLRTAREQQKAVLQRWSERIDDISK